MAQIFNTSQIAAVRQLFRDSLETFGDSFRLFYAPKWVSCSTCLTTVNSTYTNNIGLHGGPLGTICPQCNGTHKIQQEVYEDITMSSSLSQTIIKNLAPNVQVPAGSMLVRGSIADYQKLIKSIEIKWLSNAADDRYRLVRENLDGYALTTADYFVALLSRIS
jgi:hypothetical protein